MTMKNDAVEKSAEKVYVNRRQLFSACAAGVAFTALAQTKLVNNIFSSPSHAEETNSKNSEKPEKLEYQPRGKAKQSVSRWCLGNVPLAELCPKLRQIGLVGLDLIDPNDWDAVREHQMVVTIGNVPGTSIAHGFNNPKNHEKLWETYRKHIPLAAEKGVPNLICFSGNRAGLSDDEGLKNCVTGLQEILPLAEKHGVTICMELLNSKRDHKDYQCDYTAWGAKLCREIGSPRMKLLYDIYHMQIMEGDIVNTFRENKEFIAHLHTAGNPGRRDLDDAQELYYPFIIKSILATGYDGYIAHEFGPKNGLHSLMQAIKECDQ